MTTTISKHDLQIQQQQQQLQQQQQQQQQQQLLQLQQQQQQQQRFSQNKTYSLDTNTRNNTNNLIDSMTTTTTTTNTIQIDTLNNNNNLEHELIRTSPSSGGFRQNINNNGYADAAPTAPQSDEPAPILIPTPAAAAKLPKKKSLLNFRSFDFHIKSLYSGLRNGSSAQGKANSQSSNLLATSGNGVGGADAEDGRGGGVGGHPAGNVRAVGGFNANGSELNINQHHQQHHHHMHQPYNRMPPYLKIESVDNEESENLLIDYPQSPYSTRRNSSNEDNRSSSQLIQLTAGSGGGGSHQYLQQPPSASHRYEMSRSQASSPSPYFLSPHAFASSSQNIRRSSTSDIMSGSKRSACSSTSTSRRPSTSDLMRKARERRGSETRMGRSVSHGGLPRGGGTGGGAFRAGPGIGGRRTSMAY